MRVRSAQPAEERSLQEKSPKRVRQPTPSARLRDQSHDNRTTRRARVVDWRHPRTKHTSRRRLRPEIIAILAVGFGPNAFLIYVAARLMGIPLAGD